jgi:hypothetical protein
MRGARPLSRRRWCAMTVSASTCPIVSNSRHPTAFSNRESVGCEARAGPTIGSRSTSSLWIASSATRAVGVATGEPEDPLPEPLERLMVDLPRLPRIGEARGQALGQAELGIDPLEQDRAAAGAGVLGVEGGDHRLPFRIEFERDLRYTVCSHRASFSWCEQASNHRFYRTLERLDGCLVSSFTHNPG